MNTHIFVSYINKFYLRKYLLMYRSLSSNCKLDHRFLLFAFDQETCDILKSLCCPNLSVIPVHFVEDVFSISHSLLSDRTYIEYMFTLGPLIILYSRIHYPEATITFVDSDYYFFSSPDHYLSRKGQEDMRFAMHAFPAKYVYLESHGKYNVGWNTFFPTVAAYKALRRWSLLSIEWCRDIVLEGRFAEQKYLDLLESPSTQVSGISDGKMGLAEYNFFQYDISVHYDDPNGIIPYHLHSGDKIVSWHFHGILETREGPKLRINIPEARQSKTYHLIYDFYLGKLAALSSELCNKGLCPGYGNLRL